MDFCVCCGVWVPEGTMVCRECRLKYGVEKLHCRRGSNVINYKETVKVIGDKDE